MTFYNIGIISVSLATEIKKQNTEIYEHKMWSKFTLIFFNQYYVDQCELCLFAKIYRYEFPLMHLNSR